MAECDDMKDLDDYFGYLYTTGELDSKPTDNSGCLGCGGAAALLLLLACELLG